MRGEKAYRYGDGPVKSGSSPHARGKAPVSSFGTSIIRIIPACAGKSFIVVKG